jgi:hypothetical protein
MRGKAYRRHHEQRMRQRARKSRVLAAWADEGAVRRWANNMAKCSCFMCSGHKDEPTLQEMRCKLREKDGDVR